MIRTGDQYRESIRGSREIYINGDRVQDVTLHPQFRPLIDLRADLYDLQHQGESAAILTFKEEGEDTAIAHKMPFSQADWWAKRRASDHLMNKAGGVLTRTGDDIVGELWSLYDAKEELSEIEPAFAVNIQAHIEKAKREDSFLVSANADPKGDRMKVPQDQNPEMLLHVVKETDAGIVVRGAKFETAGAYANRAVTKPTIANWGREEKSEYAFGFICDLNAAGLKFICRSGFAGRASAEDYPLANKFDEIDSLVVFDDVLIPWEDVLFYRSTKAAKFIRASLHRYTAFSFVQRILKYTDMMIGAALFNIRQTGLDRLQGVQEKLSTLACYRESINAHLTAAIALAEKSPAGLMMPNQSLLYAGRVTACSQLPQMMHIARELCGGQISVTPDAASFGNPETKPWLDKFYGVGGDWLVEDRRKLLAFARDLLNSEYAGHHLSFQTFSQSPSFAHLAALYRNFDWERPLAFVKDAANLSDKVEAQEVSAVGDSAISNWFSSNFDNLTPETAVG
ncbi:4-hydroxyphenylacetate 3-hydroxylase family protein [Pseudophaeobacter sp. EL27]|uniref:4-hydroxyphenylacetate 3-hydroxylase family protein n=1 Tax=Pseudophaeobacter sp. EL27 TaxID=2107580 RepID=UPI000EFA5D5D|nr:4-hydroxyphenylacetate 3-hydroxylase family protein [Pseudophaeobacter sp. EL27]